MIKSLFLFTASLISFYYLPAHALCSDWQAPQKTGTLDHSILPEASGLAISKHFSDRLYHINDKGDEAFFYQTDLRGQNTRKISIANYIPVDTEDLAYGRCNASGTENCLVIADIGDNKADRG